MDFPAKKKAKTERKTALGVCSFKKLLEKSTIFIDKSLLIKDFLQCPAKVLLITCPRRWGKSINMDMIKTFLEIEVNAFGEKHQDKESTSNYRLFAEGMIASDRMTDCLETPLYISQHSDIIKKYQGEHPVISVNFQNVKGRNYEGILTCVKLAIRYSFQKHEYMMEVLDRIANNKQSTNSEREEAQDSLLRFKKIYFANGQEATQSDIEHSLNFLSALLYDHFKKPVYVLMDEYDTPINNILQYDRFSSEDIDKSLLLFQVLMRSTFKGNEHLAKGLLTGVFRIAKASLFPDLDNTTEYNFLDNAFARYYGFNQDEVTSLFKECNISPELSQRAEDFYNGYRVSIDPNLQIYNPWSIVLFLDSKKIKNYWAETGNIDFIKDLFKVDDIKTKIQDLMHTEDVLINLKDLKFNKEDYLTLKKLINQNINFSVTMESVNLFFCFIFAAGYLTIDVNKSSDSSSYIRLPNSEVTAELSEMLKSYYQQPYNTPLKLFNDATVILEELFESGVYEKFQQVLENIFSCIRFTEITYTEQSGVYPNGDLFHSIVNIIAIQSGYTKFGTEVSYNTGIERGRADIVLVNDDIQLGMIIETKYDHTAQEGLEQAKKYAHIFGRYNNIKKIMYVGINVTSYGKVTIATYLEDFQ